MTDWGSSSFSAHTNLPFLASYRQKRTCLGQILMVEADPSEAGLFSLMLEKAGYNLVRTDTLGEAMSAYENANFDLVLIDPCIAWEPSLEWIARLKARSPRLPVILVSTSKTEERLAQVDRLGIKTYLPKPADPHEVLKLVREALGGET